jgi:hypothetical protein
MSAMKALIPELEIHKVFKLSEVKEAIEYYK